VTARGAAKVKQTAEQLRGTATQSVESAWNTVNSAKARAADRVHKLSNAVRKIGEHMRIEEQNYIAERATDASQRLDAAADYIAEADLSTLRTDAELVARQHPGLIFGGTFLLGLAAGRFFKVGGGVIADGASPRIEPGERSARRAVSSDTVSTRRRAIEPGSTQASSRRPGEGGVASDDGGARR
jgi:hypothetical protein